MNESRQTRFVALAVLALVFTTGAAVSAIAVPPSTSPEILTSSGVSISRSLDQIDLTADQRTRVDALFASKQPQVDSIITAAIQDVLLLLNATEGEVRDLLTPAQLAEYDRLRLDAPGVTAVRRTLPVGGGTARIDTIR